MHVYEQGVIGRHGVDDQVRLDDLPASLASDASCH